MDKKFKNTLVLTFLVILAVILIIGSLVLGKYLNPFIAVLLFEVVFNFISVPSIVRNYYLLHGYDAPSVWKRYMPFYNLTIVMSPMSARLSIFSFMITIVLLILSSNVSALEFVGMRWFLIIVDYLPLVVSISSLFHFIFIGFGLGGVSLKVNELYNDYFDEDHNTREGFIKVIGAIVSSSKYLSFILYMLPVVRVIPSLTLMEHSSDLVKFKVIFPDALDPRDDECEEDVYEDDDN